MYIQVHTCSYDSGSNLYCFLFVCLKHQHSCHLEVLIIVMNTCIFNQGVNDANQGSAVINCRLSITGVFCYGVAEHPFDEFVKITSYTLFSDIAVWRLMLHSVLVVRLADAHH